MKIALHWKIIIGLVLGIVVGLIVNATWKGADSEDAPGTWAEHGVVHVEAFLKGHKVDEAGVRLDPGSEEMGANIKADGFAKASRFLINLNGFIGDIFLRCLRLIAVPIVLFSLIVGVSSLNDMSKLSRIGGKTVTIYLFTTALAISIGLGIANMVKPGTRLSEEQRTKLEQDREEMKQVADDKIVNTMDTPTPWETALNVVPQNPFGALANAKMLQVVFTALIVGIALTLIPKEKAGPVIAMCDGMTDVVIKLVGIIMFTAPYAVFALLLRVVASMGADVLGPILYYCFSVVSGLAIMIFVIYPLIMKLFTPMGYRRFFKGIAPAQLLAFSSSSSGATLPVTMECAEKRLGVKEDVSSFVLPLGATVNMDGTALYQGVAAVFIAQYYSIDLSFMDQITIVLTATMASIGTAAVPGVGIIMLVIVLEAIQVPVEGIALILGVDRILDMCRTVCNITGDAMVATVVASSENDLLSEAEVDQLAAQRTRTGLDEHPPDTSDR